RISSVAYKKANQCLWFSHSLRQNACVFSNTSYCTFRVLEIQMRGYFISRIFYIEIIHHILLLKNSGAALDVFTAY
ncbi:hypothetical protein L9F63_001130, partial [Diploptera punctata]